MAPNSSYQSAVCLPRYCVFPNTENHLTNIYIPTTQMCQIVTAPIFASDPFLKIKWKDTAQFKSLPSSPLPVIAPPKGLQFWAHVDTFCNAWMYSETMMTFVCVWNFHIDGIPWLTPLALCFGHLTLLTFLRHPPLSLLWSAGGWGALPPALAPPSASASVCYVSGVPKGLSWWNWVFDAFAENCDFWPLWCQREGTAPPPTSISHLPPPSRLLLEELYGWVWSTPPSSLPPSPSPIPHSPPFSLLSHPLPLPILLLLLQSPSLLLPAPFSLSPPLGDASLWLESWKVTQGSSKRKGILLYLKILSPDKLLQLCFCI